MDKRMKKRTIALAALTAATGTVMAILAPAPPAEAAVASPPVKAAIGGDQHPMQGCGDPWTPPERCKPKPTPVSADDPIMHCAGPKLPQWHHNCHVYSAEVTATKLIHLPGEKVTDNVAGCQPGNQPSVGKTLTYSKSVTMGGGVGVNVQQLQDIGQILRNTQKRLAPEISGNFGVSTSTSWGQNKSYNVTANYGKVSWGVFSQEAVESTTNLVIEITSTDVGGRSPLYYSANGVRVVAPLEDKQKKQPQGTLSQGERNFKDRAEFQQLCPSGALPPYLGGNDSASKDLPPGGTKIDAVNKAIQVVKDGGNMIRPNVSSDLQNRLNDIKTAINNKQDVSARVADARKLVANAASNGQITGGHDKKVDSALAAILTAK
jgi:hypothetical protein